MSFKMLRVHPMMMLAVSAVAGAACSDAGEPAGDDSKIGVAAQAVISTSVPTTTSTPIGLAVRIEQGAGVPIQVRAGQTFFINQIDMRVALDTSTDEGVSGLANSGDFATLDWCGVALEDESALDTPSADGKFTNRRFYRGARWMEKQSTFTIAQVDANGNPTAAQAMVVSAGRDDHDNPNDGFFVRRMRAIQWTFDCVSRTDCSGAQAFQEEALVELRNSLHPEATFEIQPATVSLQVVWSQKPNSPYTIPVQQVASPALDYGFTIDLIPVTAPGPDGTYPPGSDVTIQVQLRDGSGNPLHPEGVLPSFNSVVGGVDTSGIQYWRGFFEPFATYYRRKHMERQLLNQMVGPAHKVGPLHNVLDLAGSLGPDGNIYIASPETDGFFAQANGFPTFNVMFGGTFYPPLWDMPVPATITYHIPPNAEPGTYLITQKGRRVYLGEDIPASKTIEIQVGTTQHGDVPLNTGGCGSCHNNNSSLSILNHGNSNRGACTACHAPLNFELEGPVYVRTHFLHSRSDRFDAKLDRCANCHLDRAGIQRTSKSACLSCHKSYPAEHVQQFGPIDNMYVGNNVDSFQQCTAACHTNHPGSGL